MGRVTFDTAAYAKIILHAAKYPHCAVNGVLLADGSKIKDGAKNQDMDIVDSIPLFHHSHYVSPMAEVALTQIEQVAHTENRVIAGYYAACENLRDNTVEKCPGQRIADKIAEHFPSAVFIVVDNKRLSSKVGSPAIKLHRLSDGKWRLHDDDEFMFQSPYILDTVSMLLQGGVHKELIDFDNYLDDPSQSWTNRPLHNLIAHMDAEDAGNDGDDDADNDGDEDADNDGNEDADNNSDDDGDDDK